MERLKVRHTAALQGVEIRAGCGICTDHDRSDFGKFAHNLCLKVFDVDHHAAVSRSPPPESCRNLKSGHARPGNALETTRTSIAASHTELRMFLPCVIVPRRQQPCPRTTHRPGSLTAKQWLYIGSTFEMQHDATCSPCKR